ncbi:hypothetical protein [Verticiella sediminum]|nr:hypothetical protein [Verticiella sediminum]
MEHQPVEPDTPDAPIPVEPDPVPPTPDDERARPGTIERGAANAAR